MISSITLSDIGTQSQVSYFVITGNQTQEFKFGSDLNAADVNGGGYIDIYSMYGNYVNATGKEHGRAFIVYGSTSGWPLSLLSLATFFAVSTQYRGGSTLFTDVIIYIVFLSFLFHFPFIVVSINTLTNVVNKLPLLIGLQYRICLRAELYEVVAQDLRNAAGDSLAHVND